MYDVYVRCIHIYIYIERERCDVKCVNDRACTHVCVFDPDVDMLFDTLHRTMRHTCARSIVIIVSIMVISIIMFVVIIIIKC